MSSTSIEAGGYGSSGLHEMNSFENEHMPKIRKPYTITKQREKWTDEEHQKFLEALKLYGRGWRQIEEHVGTKTAVQIRSHAQKFFSKVARESNGSTESSMKPIEIPPPRPKRKPVRPYPRKSIDSFKGASFTNQVERTPSPNGLVSDNQSPTSVLPAFVSYGLGSGISDQQNRCSSPTSCTTENDYMTSNSSPEEAKSSSGLRTQQSANSTVEEFLPLKTESQSNHSTGVKEEVRRMQPSPSIKLFGKTVSVTDTQKPYCSGFESSMSPISDNNVVDFETDNGSFRQEIPRKHLDTQLSLGLVSASKSDGEVSPHTNMELSDPAAVACATPAMPVMVLHQGLPVVYLMSDKPTSAGTLMVSNLKVKEGSCAGSSAGSVSDQETRERSSDASVDSQWRQGSTPVGRNPNNCSKGFVPYKRCLAEAEMKSSIASEERERQRARVCS